MNKVFLLLSLVPLIFAYQWPMRDSLNNPDNKKITSNFGDYRSGHFHEGLDIPAQENALSDSLYIWPIDIAIVLKVNRYYAKIRHCFTNFDSAKDEGSRYIHAYTYQVCEEGDTLSLDDPVAQGWRFEPNSAPHLHLEYRAHDGDSLNDSKNPFVIDTLQVDETERPILNHLYVDYSCHGSANVENLNFLGYDFSSYYRDTTYGGITFRKLKLPAETPDNDLDDPHILISGNRKARFVLEAHDNFFSTTDRGAPYELSLFLFDVNSLGVIKKSYFTI